MSNVAAAQQNNEPTALNDMLIKPKLFAIVGALLPGVACYACIAYSYLFQFHRIQNFTVPVCPEMHSWLPPVSYIIGVWEPTRTFWLFVMFLHFPARLFYPFLYNHLYKAGCSKYVRSWWYVFLRQCFIRTMFLEACALITISVIDVVTQFYVHATAFGVWLLSLNFNMLASAILQYFSVADSSNRLNPLFYIKLTMCFTGTILSLSTAYTYPYSTTTCSNFTYLLFSIAEYTLVAINSLFYFLIYWECSKVHIGLSTHELDAMPAGKNEKMGNLLMCINSRKK